MNVKICSVCGQKKKLFEFYKHKTGKGGVRSICKVCDLIRAKKYRQENPLKRAECMLQYSYGIGLKDYEKMFKKQGGRCFLCGCEQRSDQRFCVDHDHQTGRIRGLLCKGCNSKLGWFENRRSIILAYLQE